MRFALLTLSLVPLLVHADLNVAVCDCDSPPLLTLNTEKSQPTGGLIKDLVDLYGKQLGQAVRYRVLSRKRLELALQQGETDLVCFTHPNWTNIPERLNWSGDTVPQIEVVIQNRVNPFTVQQQSDLKGMRVGLILGFHYGELDALIKQQQVHAVYSAEHLSNYRLLEKRSLDAVISTDIQFAQYLQDKPTAASELMVSSFVFSTTPTQCGSPKNSKLAADDFAKASQMLRTQGAFDRLMNHYRAPLLKLAK